MITNAIRVDVLRRVFVKNASIGQFLVKILTVLVCTIILGCPLLAQSWSNGYAFQSAITINDTQVPNTDQVNFPVLISGTYGFLATIGNGGNVTNPNGYDIIFTSDPAGMNVLPFEQEVYNPSTGTVAYWVQLPIV